MFKPGSAERCMQKQITSVIWLDLGKFSKYDMDGFYSVNNCRKILAISVLVFALVSRYWAPFLRQGIRNMVDSENGRRTQFVKMTGKSYLLPMHYGVKIGQVAP